MNEEWFLPTMGRAEAEAYLSRKPVSGSFIVRASTQPESYALSYLDDKFAVNHSLIKKAQLGYVLPDIPHAVFPTLLALVSACNFLRPVTNDPSTAPTPSKDSVLQATCEVFPHTPVDVVRRILDENNWNESAASDALLSLTIAEPPKKDFGEDYISTDPLQEVVLSPPPARSMNLDLLMAKVEAAARGTTIPTTIDPNKFQIPATKLPKGTPANLNQASSHYSVNKLAPKSNASSADRLEKNSYPSSPASSPQSSGGKIPSQVQQIYNSTTAVNEALMRANQQPEKPTEGIYGSFEKAKIPTSPVPKFNNNILPNGSPPSSTHTPLLRQPSATSPPPPTSKEFSLSPQTSPREIERMSVVAVFLEHFKSEQTLSPNQVMDRWYELPRLFEVSVGSFEANLFKVLQNLSHPLGLRVKEFVDTFNSSATNVTCARAIGETQNFIAALQNIIATKVRELRNAGGEQVVWRVITTALFPSIYENLYKLAADQSESSNMVKRKKMKFLAEVDMREYGVTANGFSKAALSDAIKRLDEMSTVTTVKEKLDCLTAVITAIHEVTKANPIKADDLPPYLAYLLVHSGVNDLVTQWLLMRNFTPSFCVEGIEGFALATLEATIDFFNSDVVPTQFLHNNPVPSTPPQQLPAFTRGTSKTNAPEPPRSIIMGKARRDTLLRNDSPPTTHSSHNSNMPASFASSYEAEMSPFDPQVSPRQPSASSPSAMKVTTVQIPPSGSTTPYKGQPASPTGPASPSGHQGEVSELPRGRTNSEQFAPILEAPFSPGPDPTVLQSKGNCDESFEKLENAYVEALKGMKGNVKALNKLAAYYFVEGNYAKALDKTDKVLKMDPKNATAKANFPIYLSSFQNQYQT